MGGVAAPDHDARLSAELLARYTKAGPRYTSYPTVPAWSQDIGDDVVFDELARSPGPHSVYVHVPFCREQCTFCGCNMVVAGRREPGARYLDALERQVAGLRLPTDPLPVVRIHLGGGTPTWFTARELERLFAILHTRFAPVAGAEISVEADPEVTSHEQVDALAGVGVNRLSFGVQSFDPGVLAAVNRPQDTGRVHALVHKARSLGMHSLNLDVMYGLPAQTLATFARTLDTLLQMRPDRLAVFGYAHVPWLKAHQKKIDAAALPGPAARTALFFAAHDRLTAAGYQAIGMDHFALPDDELATAQRAGALHRNFMGYTTRPGGTLLGLGMSAISETPSLYAQQEPKLARWWRAVEGDGPVMHRGVRVSAQDRLVRAVIYGLMCNFQVDLAAICADYGADPARFAPALASLAPMVDDGLVALEGHAVRVTPRGRLLVRNVAMAFDPSLSAPRASGGPRFSQTV